MQFKKAGMVDGTFAEDLMERVRSLVRAEAWSVSPPSSVTEQILSRLQREFPEIAQGITPDTVVVSAATNFTWLQAELEACISAAGGVGELKARHPGFVNDRLQDVKRMMRRSLSWYTRPLRLFHGAVVRALQQMTVALEKQWQALGERALQRDLIEANRRVDDVEQGTCHLHELAASALKERDSTRKELAALRGAMCELQAELVAALEQVEHIRAELRAAKGSLPESRDGHIGHVAVPPGSAH